MLLAVLSGFIVASIIPLIGKWLKGKWSVVMTMLPLTLFVYFLSLIPSLPADQHLLASYNWVLTMGINLSFLVDGLSLLFALMITGIGVLVFLYTSAYMKGDAYLDRFYGYLSLFMGAMLGMVLSDNIFTLFVFWELTSISSFFLIGYKNESTASRKSALIALAVTGLGGFFLLAAFAMLGTIAGTYSIQEMIGSGDQLKEHPAYLPIMVCLFFAAFSKSAQFPLHFWLPGAMKAPTPVSTYLHSATMVKAGIYLLARFTPVLGNVPEWNNTLLIVGGFTMLYAAFHAIFKKDLKEILAYSTISALGMLVFLLGLGTSEALLAMLVFIVVHALYKATLFLVTGIIDHQTGTRDTTVLSGLRKVMLPVAIAGGLAMLSNSGIPPTIGFVGKDLVYASTLSSEGFAIIMTVVAVITNILLLYASVLAGIKPFAGKLPSTLENTRLPEWRLWLPPLVLGIAGLVLGFFPHILEGGILGPALNALVPSAAEFHLQLWHGFNFVLALSAITIAGGLLLYRFFKPGTGASAILAKLHKTSPENIAHLFNRNFRVFATRWTSVLQNGYLRIYILTIVFFLTALMAYKSMTKVVVSVNLNKVSPLTSTELVVMSILIIAIIYAVYTPSRLSAIAAMGVIGYCVCLIYVFYSAPDLAMTQFAIDTLTVILFVLVLYRFPNTSTIQVGRSGYVTVWFHWFLDRWLPS
ncbi:proton-conducting transporter membrane subunit [Segetibacter sp. 3557_3]|uniref:proton-conducting transporter transmembrane domain-containing protein n=1 Tax=Segetibacter sp. 3557_3 TaxID=2547429 RepID=UPI001A9D2A49|nr:proton-conducting transporter membrane subunit [Segetibacter sp. 3557_3]